MAAAPWVPRVPGTGYFYDPPISHRSCQTTGGRVGKKGVQRVRKSVGGGLHPLFKLQRTELRDSWDRPSLPSSREPIAI